MEFGHILFLGFAALAVVAAFNVILQRNPIYSAIGLIIVLCSLAALFLTLSAQFIAAMQIIVYAGAIMVLFVFVIMLLNVREEETRVDKQKYLKWLAAPLFLALLAEVMAVVRYVSLTPQPLQSAADAGGQQKVLGTVENIAQGMFTNYVIPFEAASVLILMAIVGSMLLARRDNKEDIDRIEKALVAQQEEEEKGKYEEEVAA
jgi:NADH-quinone oxidoreductase subunit J